MRSGWLAGTLSSARGAISYVYVVVLEALSSIEFSQLLLPPSPLSKSEERDSTTMLEEQEELLNNTKATDQCFVIFLPSSGGEKPRQFNELASGMVLNNETTARSAKGEDLEGDRPF